MEKITIDILQRYLLDRYKNIRTEQNLFMKLVEEIGEVSEILNMRSGIKDHNGKDLTDELGTELADVIHYTIAIAAINKINLNDIILKKDAKASIKYKHKINLSDFIKENENKK